MNLRRHVMPDHAVIDDTMTDASVDTTILDDERFADEFAGTVEIAAAFLASADTAALASAFATFTCGLYRLDELRADLWHLGAWIRANA